MDLPRSAHSVQLLPGSHFLALADADELEIEVRAWVLVRAELRQQADASELGAAELVRAAVDAVDVDFETRLEAPRRRHEGGAGECAQHQRTYRTSRVRERVRQELRGLR